MKEDAPATRALIAPGLFDTGGRWPAVRAVEEPTRQLVNTARVREPVRFDFDLIPVPVG